MDSTSSSPLQWRTAGQSVRGSVHERAGAPNQDALQWLSLEAPCHCILMAISDGHGSTKSFRSEIGSEIAVQVMTRGMHQFLESHIKAGLDLSAVKQDAEDLLPESLVREWKKDVEKHLVENPFTPQERDRLKETDGETGLEAVRKNVFLAYGATALGMLITEQFMLCLQLGDGDILTVETNGQVTRPIPKDERLFANQTTSLCSSEAWKDFSVYFQPLPTSVPSLILLATDGYANSFRDDAGFLQVGSDLCDMIRDQGWEMVTEKLADWLMEASRDGSGDDITVGLAAPNYALQESKWQPRNFLDFVPWVSAPQSSD